MLKKSALAACILAVGLWAAAVSARQGRATTTLSDQDRTEIQALAGRYARALGSCSADEYAELFATPDGYFASGTSGKVLGHTMLAGLVLGQAHCINDTAIGGGPRSGATAARGTGTPGADGRGGNGPALTIETSDAGVTGRSTLRDHGHYEDVYIKTAQGWRFKSRTHLSSEQERARLTAQDYEDIRALAGEGRGEYTAVYVDTPKGPRFRSAGLVIEPSPEGATGKAILADGSRYEDVYVKGPAGWRFKSRQMVRSSARNAAVASDSAGSGAVTLPTGFPERPFVRVNFDKLTWRPTEGNTLGVETAVIEGDPSKPGYYLTINHFPKGVMSRPHHHPDERYCIVLRGTWYTDEGEVFRPGQTIGLKPGDFMRHPKGGPHYDGALDEDVWVAISGYGPTTATVLDGGALFGRSR